MRMWGQWACQTASNNHNHLALVLLLAVSQQPLATTLHNWLFEARQPSNQPSNQPNETVRWANDMSQWSGRNNTIAQQLWCNICHGAAHCVTVLSRSSISFSVLYFSTWLAQPVHTFQANVMQKCLCHSLAHIAPYIPISSCAHIHVLLPSSLYHAYIMLISCL